MNELRLVYKILKIIERSLDYEEFDNDPISAETLKVSVPRWSFIIKMLVDKGYIAGVKVQNLNHQDYPCIQIQRPSVTLDGLEYLNDNKMMKKISNAAKGIAEIF